MTAFDTAWDLVKMPYVQGSAEKDPDIPGVYQGVFQEKDSPQQRKIGIDMRSGFSEPEGWVSIDEATDFVPYPYGSRGVSVKQPRAVFDVTGSSKTRAWKPTSVFTPPLMRGRGYMTAIYDMLAELLAERGMMLKPGRHQSESGQALWDNRFPNLNPTSIGRMGDLAQTGGVLNENLYHPDLHWLANRDGDYSPQPSDIKDANLEEFYATHKWVGQYPNARWVRR
tara:strand:+ start:2542 stop:3216 length:675 start_codon:yes stop_codon:yes gene_type:complete